MHWFRSKQEWYKTHPSKTRTFILWIPLQSDKVPFFLFYFFFFTYSPFSSTTLFFVSMPLATKHPQCNPINLKCYVSSSLPTELFCLLEPVNIYDVQFVCICHFTRCCVRVFETIPYYVFLKGREIQSQTVFIVNGIKCTTSSQKQDLTHCCLASRSRLTRNIKGRGCERKTMWSLSLHFFVTLCCPSITRVCTCFSLFSCSSRSQNMTPKQSTAIHHPYLSSWCV